MSRESRNLEDGGDQIQGRNTSNDTSHAPIRFLEPRMCDLTLSVPSSLIGYADQGGKHRDNLRFELALYWRRYVQDGEFPVSRTLLDELYTSTFRRKLKDILNAVAKPSRSHSNYAGSSRCKAYEFKFRRPKKAPTYNGIPEEAPAKLQPRADHVSITIPAAWLWDRYERWTEICNRNDWTSNLDLDGRTDWGRPLLDALESVALPEAPETVRLTNQGVVKAAMRKRGRCYHPMTNLRKDLRRESLLKGEPTAEVDIHACYTALLISRLPDGEAKDKAIDALKSDWYAQFQNAYAEWFSTQLASGRGYILDGKWMIRLDGDPTHDTPASIKVEYQRQCLFWRDPRNESNPLRVVLRQLHPELCRLIENWRQILSPTELSDVLTRAEGSLVVDSLMAELENARINSITVHDAVVVPASRAEEAREIMLRVCEWHLGFKPCVSIKASKIDFKVMLLNNADALTAINSNGCRQLSTSQGKSHARDF